MSGVEVAYYLIHAIGTGPDFERTEEAVARTFATVARESGVQRIVYLGGLAHDDNLSEHLRSRAEVGEILLASGVPTAALGAATVDRLRVVVLRDAALPHRAAAGDDHPAVGAHPDPADRDPRRPALPRGLRDAAAGREPHVRHRRSRTS